jgi:hypothetical protein
MGGPLVTIGMATEVLDGGVDVGASGHGPTLPAGWDLNLHRRGDLLPRQGPGHAQVLRPWITISGARPTQRLVLADGTCSDVYTNVC